MEIELQVFGEVERLRAFADRLQALLGDDAEVRGFLGKADAGDEPQDGTITVDVLGAADEFEAYERLHPLMPQADPEWHTLITGGTTAIRHLIPKPPDHPGRP
jgi:hypothetical protein